MEFSLNFMAKVADENCFLKKREEKKRLKNIGIYFGENFSVLFSSQLVESWKSF